MKLLLKKTALLILSVSMLASSVTVHAENDGNVAANDPSVKYSLNNGTLTISGTGAAEQCDDNIYQARTTITKVVVKKGITKLGSNALPDLKKVKSITIASTVKEIGQSAIYCQNLDKLTMPGDFKCPVPPMGPNDDWEDYNPDPSIMLAFHAKSIYLNTPIKKMNQTKYMSFWAKKVYTAKSDKKYKSYNGVIYTKNGKKLVYVPCDLTKLNVRKGCKSISLRGMTYSRNIDGEACALCELSKVTLPSSLRNVIDDTYKPAFDCAPRAKWTIKSKKIKGSGIANLSLLLSKKNMNKLFKKSKNIKKTKGMWITKDHILVRYQGKAKAVAVPKGVKKIWEDAFIENHKIKSIKFPKSLKTIKDYAFFRCLKLKTVKWNNNLKSIGTAAFQLTALTTFKLPKSVTKFGEYSFESCNFTKIVFPKNMKKIPVGMFGGTKVKNLVIPGYIKTIGRYAFADSKIETLTFGEGVEKIETHAFDECDKIKKVTLTKSIQNIENCAFVDTVIQLLVLNGFEGGAEYGALFCPEEIDAGKVPAQYVTYPFLSMTNDNAPYPMQITVAKVTGASGMEVEIADNPEFQDAFKKELPNVSGDVTINRPSANHTNYRIRVFTEQDGSKVYGPWTKFAW